MNIKVENIEKNVVKLEITVSDEKFKEGMQKSFVKNKNRFSIQGFRKGKAPRNIVERYYGEQVLYEDAINYICPEVYDAAVEEYQLNPVEMPEIDIVQIGNGESFIFTATVTVKPEVELGEYKGVEVTKQEVKVTQEDVDREVNATADKNSRIVPLEEDRGIIQGDITIIDFEGFIDGVPFEGGKASEHQLAIGSGEFIEGFEEQLKGMKKGDNTEVKVTFPQDYGKEELAGKAAVFKVLVREIKIKEQPSIDDEFAKDVSEFDSLSQYREDIYKKLIEKEEHRIKHETEDALVKKVMDNFKVEIPSVMVEKQIDSHVKDYDMRLRYQGIDLNKYLEITKSDMNTFREYFRKQAENDVKTQLVLEKIAEVEEIKASEEQLDKEIDNMADRYKQEKEDFRKHLRDEDIEYIKNNIVIEQTVDFLVRNAKVKIV